MTQKTIIHVAKLADDNYWKVNYGIQYETLSGWDIKVTGKNVHNRSFSHKVTMWGNGELMMRAQATVISNPPQPRPTVTLSVATGETVTVRFVDPMAEKMEDLFFDRDYVVTARMCADPILVPVEEVK